jgi:hypothetical protein
VEPLCTHSPTTGAAIFRPASVPCRRLAGTGAENRIQAENSSCPQRTGC